MRKSLGPPETRYRCCIDSSCKKFESPWEVGSCYDGGGRIVRDCSTCGDLSEEIEVIVIG